MAEDSDAGEKTEEPTQYKRDKARERGQVARSADMSAAMVLFTGLLGLRLGGGYILDGLAGAFRGSYSMLHAPGNINDDLPAFTMIAAVYLIELLFPLVLCIMVVGAGTDLLQVGGLQFSADSITPKPEKLNPLSGLGRLFSLRSVMTLIMSTAKMSAIGFAVALYVEHMLGASFSFMDFGVHQVFYNLMDSLFWLGIVATSLLLAIAIADVTYQRYQHTKDLRMTRQEVVDEMKEHDGDPNIRARRKQIMLEQSRQRMLADVPDADVVITNPVHIAVALKYDLNKGPAPIVVAKGERRWAAKIKMAADLAGIMKITDPPLAQLIYKNSEVGDAIPYEAYDAVATVLGEIFKRTNNGDLKRKSA